MISDILKLFFNSKMFKLWYFITFYLLVPSKKYPDKRKRHYELKLKIDRMITDNKYYEIKLEIDKMTGNK